jgi:uncharacterized protein YaaR (DUF327 family)
MEPIERSGEKSVFGKSERKKSQKSSLRADKSFRSILNPFVRKTSDTYDIDDFRNQNLPLENLLDDVYEQGEELKNSPTFEHIKSYKKSVKRFMDYIVKNTVKIEEKISGVNILKRKRFTLLEIVDTKLESLVSEVLRSQKDQVSILKKVDEINGLLVDLMQ